MMLLVLLYALFAGTFSLGKIILGYTKPFFLVGVRMTIAGLILLGYQWYVNKKAFSIKKRDWSLFAQAIIFTIYIHYFLRFWGLKHIASSKACLIYNFGPFITFLFSYLLFSEKVTFKKVLGLIIGFCGLLPVILRSSACGAISGNSMGSFPELAILCSVTSASYGWLIIHRLIKKRSYSPIFTNGIIMTSGGLLSLITSFFVEGGCQDCVTDVVPFIGILAVIIIISNLLCHNLYAMLLKQYSPTMVSFAGFLTPIFASFYGWIFLRETVTMQFAVACCVVFIGLALFYQDELKHRNTQAQDEALTSPAIDEI